MLGHMRSVPSTKLCCRVKRIELRAKEEAEDSDDAAGAGTVNKLRAGYEGCDVARRRGACDGWLVLFEERLGDEHALEEVRKLGVE